MAVYLGKGVPQSNILAQLFAEDMNIISDGIAGLNIVLSGLAVTAQGSPDMTVAVAKGCVLTNGVCKAVAAGNANITTANGTNPRLDLVVINSSGAIAVRAGTAAAAPIPPARSTNDVVLAIVLVPANDTTIGSDQIRDTRQQKLVGPILIGKTTTPVTQNTLGTIFTLFTQAIASGLLLSGRSLRFKCGGNYLANSGTPTWTFTISYGGTTMFADATGVTTADADRGAWNMELIVVAQANNDQALNGNIVFQTPGAKTAPTTGQGGDLSVTTSVVTPIAGSAAVDSDAADRTFLVQCTMSVSNAADETVMEYATLELL